MALFTLIIWGFTSLNFADHLLQEGDPYHAITEYKRLLYEGNLDSLHAFIRIAWSYEHRGRRQDALTYWARANLLSSSPLIRTKMAILMIRDHQDASAKYLLLQPDISRPYTLLRSVYFTVQNRDPAAKQTLDSLGIRTPWLPTRRTVFWLSLFLPGMPQVLLGQPWQGLLSLFSTAGTLYWTYRLYRQGDPLDATLVGTTLFLRFYTGALSNALKLLQRRKHQFLLSVAQEVKPLIVRRLRSLQLIP